MEQQDLKKVNNETNAIEQCNKTASLHCISASLIYMGVGEPICIIDNTDSFSWRHFSELFYNLFKKLVSRYDNVQMLIC